MDGFGADVTVVNVFAWIFVNAKFTDVAPVALAVTLYGPPTMPFAVAVAETPPLALIVLVKGVVSAMLAPEVGAVKEMTPPATGSAYALVTLRASGCANAVLIVVD